MTNKVNKKKRKKSQKRKSYPFNNKKFVGCLCLCLLALITVTATFAWTSYTEWVKNHLQSTGAATTELDIKVNEKVNDKDEVVDFSSNMSWQLGSAAEHKKDVKVENIRDSAAIVRLTLSEVMLTFKMGYDIYPRAEFGEKTDTKDTYSYGDVFRFSSIAKDLSMVDKDDTSTWTPKDKDGVQQYFQSKHLLDGKEAKDVTDYYQAKERIENIQRDGNNKPILVGGKPVPLPPIGINYDNAKKETTVVNRSYPLKDMVELTFNNGPVNDPDKSKDKVKSAANPPEYITVDGKEVFNEKDFWYYDDTTGYFYYSEILDPMGGDNTITTPVLTNITLKSYANEYKQALYGINVNAEGLRPIAAGVDSAWLTDKDGVKIAVSGENKKFFDALKAKLSN